MEENKVSRQKLVERYIQSKASLPELETFIELYKQGELEQVLDAYLDQQIEASEPVSFRPKYTRVKTLWAACITLAVLSGGIFYARPYFRSTVPVHYTQVRTQNQGIRKVSLSDGSVIWLNRNSSLQYADPWQGDTREIQMQTGEAYFQVAKNKKHPRFIVRTPDQLTVEVKGTQFDVRTQKGSTRVFLEEGKVALKKEQQVAELSPGQLATYDQRHLTVQSAKGDVWLAWKNELFVFDDATLTEIAHVLEAYYDIHVVIQDHLDHLKFTGKLSQKDLGQVLNILARTLDVEIVQRKGLVTIREASGTAVPAE